MALEAIVPIDVARLIAAHACSSAIQRAFRSHAMRHSARPVWRALRSLLVRHATPREVDVLARTAWVRHEWRIEASSWAYMLEHETHLLRMIIDECSAARDAFRRRALS